MVNRVLNTVFVSIMVSAVAHAKSVEDYEKLTPGERVIARGALFYSKPMLIDVDGDGVKNRLVLAAKLFVKKSVKGYEGYLIRGMYDIDKKRALRYFAGSNPEGRQPPAGDNIDIQNIEYQGKTVSFDFYGLHYIIKDGGGDFITDEVIVKTRNSAKRLKLYGGGVDIADQP